MTDEQKMAMYLDWVNNFLTVGAFADYYGITIEKASEVIKQGRELHEARVTKRRQQA